MWGPTGSQLVFAGIIIIGLPMLVLYEGCGYLYRHVDVEVSWRTDGGNR